jgi:hypothetical protein
MKKLIILLGLLVLGSPVGAADISGVWDLAMVWQSTDSHGTCAFKQENEKLTGTCGGDDKFPITGEVVDKKLKWQFDVEQNGNKGRMTFDGVVDDAGTTIKGTCSIVGGQSGNFTMKKR